MIMGSKFRINKYSQVFNRVGTSYRGLEKFIIVYQFISFSSEENNSGFANVEFHEVRSAPTLYRINVRLKSIAFIRRFNDTEDFDIISEKKIPRVINYITHVIHEYVEKQRPQNRSLRNATQHYKRR
jgi:hypothetical protein